MSILQHYRTLLPRLLRHKLFEINVKQIHYNNQYSEFYVYVVHFTLMVTDSEIPYNTLSKEDKM